ncbi:LOW QUALITY PROTEIN: prominin-1-A [Xylocopa sonorina]|uniref:LOW QUALITY PROTEIN: prominin-1-A n=1 Tax=Xylocopa sonorina TaxID=1818115 RepID=UPI00403A8E29
MVRFRVPSSRVEASVRSDASPALVAIMIFVFVRGFRPSAVVHYGFAILGLLSILLVSCPVNCQETLTNRMRVISENLDRQLNAIMASQAFNYTTLNASDVPYNATTTFNPKGMGQLYNVTNMFIDFVQSKQAFPEGMLTVVNGAPHFDIALSEWRIIVTHYGGLAGLAFVGLLLAAILPCVGLFFCCCRCAGHCGARSQPFDKKHDHCRKVMLSMVLIAVATIILFGVVCAFVTNEYMQDGTKELPSNVKTSLKDVKLYLNRTKQEINKILVENNEELRINLNNVLQASGSIVTKQLANSSNAVSLTNLSNIMHGLESIKEDLSTVDEITNYLRSNATYLDYTVRRLKSSLLHTLGDCKSHQCKDVLQKYNVNDMKIEIHFDKYMDRYFPKLQSLPDVTSVRNNITALMSTEFVSEVNKGKNSFLNIEKDIQKAVHDTIPSVGAAIENLGNYLSSIARNMTAFLDNLNSDIDRVYMKQLDVAQVQIDQYSPYRYYLGLGMSGIVLTVLMCLTFGLFCGICGKRPDGYGDDCCNKGSGARFLMMAVWIIFLLTSVLMVIIVAHMVTGVLVQRAICEPLKNPNDNRMFALIDEMVQIKKMLYPSNPNVDLNVSYIITHCHRKESLYQVLNLKYAFDLTQLRDHTGRSDINSTIQKLCSQIRLSSKVIILSGDAKSNLQKLAQSGLSDISFYKYEQYLADNITNINLQDLAQQLQKVVLQLPAEEEAIKGNLSATALELQEKHEQVVKPLQMYKEILAKKAIALEKNIKFNHSSMEEAINSVIGEVTRVQDFLNNDGPRYVQDLAANFGNALLRQVDDYLEQAIDQAQYNVGKCGPISNAYNATLVAGCNRILDPFNGFWASVGWCLVLFIPTIILCVKLSALYQKSDPYPGPLVEAEYLYDAYADRDNIPLTHVHDKKYVSHSRDSFANFEYYDGPAGGYSERERVPEAHQSTSHYHHYSRYSDVAPNSTPTWRSHELTAPSKTEPHNKVFSISIETQNCDFPNGGPPGYQPAVAAPPPLSTEYERPPPYYYYPGPGDTN